MTSTASSARSPAPTGTSAWASSRDRACFHSLWCGSLPSDAMRVLSYPPRGRVMEASPNRRAGWWGIAFAVLLLVYGAMVSTPASDDPARHIRAFYDDHRGAIVAQQLVGLLALLPFLLFALPVSRATSGTRVLGSALLLALAVIA